MMLIEAPLDAEQALSESSQNLARHSSVDAVRRLRPGLFNRDGNFIFKLNAIAEPIVNVEVGYLVCSGGKVTIANPTEVDLPMFVPRGLWIVGAERRPTLGVSRHCRQNKQRYREHTSQNALMDAWERGC
jgi:hypothetical protein